MQTPKNPQYNADGVIASTTNGVCLSAVATSYILFLAYFDLLRNRAHLKDCRQLIYSLFHFPFHASLLLYSIGSATFIQWWQAVSTGQFVRSCIHLANVLI